MPNGRRESESDDTYILANLRKELGKYDRSIMLVRWVTQYYADYKKHIDAMDNNNHLINVVIFDCH